MKDTTIILPTLNEEGNIRRMLETLLRLYPGIRIVVADDGSRDNTRKIVKQFAGSNVSLVDRSREPVKGLTASVLDACGKTNTRNIIVMDCDFQHPPEKVGEIAILLSRYGLIIGARESTPGWSLQRKIFSLGGTILAGLRMAFTLRRPLPDPMSGFFGIRANLLKNAPRNRFVLEGFKVLFDTAKTLPRKTKIGTVYYQFGLRSAGESKIGKRHFICMLKSLVR